MRKSKQRKQWALVNPITHATFQASLLTISCAANHRKNMLQQEKICATAEIESKRCSPNSTLKSSTPTPTIKQS